MPTTVRQQVQVFVDAALSPAARAAQLAAVAKQGVADLIASGQASPRFQRFVDGRADAPEESVDGRHGVILYQFSSVADATAAALDFLRARAPARSGDYRNSFYVAVDGRFIPARMFRMDSVPPSAEIVIGNTEPYSRKVDVQLVGSKPLRFSVPPGLFDDAARDLRRRFGNTVTVKRVYSMNFPGQYRLRQTTHRAGSHRVARKAGTLVESPALIIRPVG